ncbi:hypothetical protein PoB_007454100 [Plakobranchus ocellatus]|uniref:Uncharacterized protein n=1 Tax=Plakobranchus ocellatus TaxID=259542 RepID=A0AAV4DVB0_9GAST|nr:hypothetical protein PoB_007454100 [Plakobranchus ocellatus]
MFIDCSHLDPLALDSICGRRELPHAPTGQEVCRKVHNKVISGHPSGRDADGGAGTRNRMVPADLRADSQATVLPTPAAYSGANTTKYADWFT